MDGLYEKMTQIVEDAVECALKNQAEQVRNYIAILQMQIQELRQALNEAGYPIPPGLDLDKWIPYIREGRKTEQKEAQ